VGMARRTERHQAVEIEVRAPLGALDDVDRPSAACRSHPFGCSTRVYSEVRDGVPSMAQLGKIVHSDPDILGGTPVFVDTRVPIQSLFEYLEGGETLDEFLRQFPSVTRELAVAALELARTTLLAGARPS
jgi:uncharacterized protein (DUF433 family)